MVSAPIERWKSRYITRLADFQSHHGPTDSAEEAKILGAKIPSEIAELARVRSTRLHVGMSLAHVMPKAFIAAVIGSEKNTGSTRYTTTPDTSSRFRLFSSGINALRTP